MYKTNKLASFVVIDRKNILNFAGCIMTLLLLERMIITNNHSVLQLNTTLISMCKDAFFNLPFSIKSAYTIDVVG